MEKFRKTLTLSLKINIVDLYSLLVLVGGEGEAGLTLNFQLGHRRQIAASERVDRLSFALVVSFASTLHDRLPNGVDCRLVEFLLADLPLFGEELLLLPN